MNPDVPANPRAPYSALERYRRDLRLPPGPEHQPRWRFAADGPDFLWLFDGDRAVALLCRSQETFELRCAGPQAPCAPAVLPKHYHTVTQVGTRIIYNWRLKGKGCGQRLTTDLVTRVTAGTAEIDSHQQWSDGTRARTVLRVGYDAAWGAYVADVEATLQARRVTCALEFCNILPAGIGDSRPGRGRYPFTFWQHPDGLRKLWQNPLWFCAAGAQDIAGEKRLADGGFLGFGPDAALNPVVEIVASDPACGAATCDGLQDEHLMALPAEGRHAMATGWTQLAAQYRFFSLPQHLAEALVTQAALMKPGAMMAWKFQYPAIPELPADLTAVELPGSPFYGAADWSRPVPWDAPFNGRLWTASPDPRAAIHYDRTSGRNAPGSIRLRAAGEELAFSAGSGHTLHTDAGVRYRFSAWLRTRGQARGWITASDMLFRLADGRHYDSAQVGPDCGWTYVEAEFVARGDDAPFADLSLHAAGTGDVWFADTAFEPLA